jgi:Protein of unknown function (DUF3175)
LEADVRRLQCRATEPAKSGQATQKSGALDLEGGVFASNDPHEIAVSLKKSAGKRRMLEAAKGPLRKEFGRDKK